MIISTSQNILSLDESILAVCIMDSNFETIEATSKQSFERKIKIPNNLKKKSGDFAAAIFGTAQLSTEIFGKVNYIVVDYGKAKALLMSIEGNRFIGLMLNSSVNVDYVAHKVAFALGSRQDVQNMHNMTASF